MGNPIGTWKAGEIVDSIRVRLRNLHKDQQPTEIDKRFPKRFLLRELNFALPELQEYGGVKDSTEQAGAYSVNSVTDNIDLTLLTDYKNIDKITHIEFAPVDDITRKPGRCVELKEAEFANLKWNINTSNYRDSVIWYRKGDVIYFAKGSGISDYGMRTIFYTRKPVKAITYETLLDISDGSINKVITRVIRNVTGQALSPAGDELNSQAVAKDANREEKAVLNIKS